MTAEPQHQAVSAEEADQVFACLEPFDTVLVAVSGGPDSLGLLYLVKEWSARRAKNPALPANSKIIAATVDHQLRPQSAAEADLVAGHCAKLGVPHTILKWQQKPWSGLMAAARDARYELLVQHLTTTAGSANAAIVTAHTLDDQAETLIMRLKRGSGVEGLAAIPARRAVLLGSDVQLVRPLLAIAKTRLMATLQSRGVLWCDDPTNDDAHYERVRVRRLLQTLDQSGVTAEALARTARRMQDANEGLDYAHKLFLQTLNRDLHGGLFASFDRVAFDGAPAILRQRVLRDVIAVFGGATPRPEALEIEHACARFAAALETRLTLGGATVSAGPKLIRIWREPARIKDTETIVNPGARVLWDDRFWVAVSALPRDEGTPGVAGAISVRPLGHAGYAGLASVRDPKIALPAAAAHGLPAFWQGDELLAVPLLQVVTVAGKRFAPRHFSCDPASA